jgi:hypothetical protein
MAVYNRATWGFVILVYILDEGEIMLDQGPKEVYFNENDYVICSLTGDKVYTSRPLTNVDKAQNALVRLRDHLEYASAFEEKVDQGKLIEEVERILHLLQNTSP